MTRLTSLASLFSTSFLIAGAAAGAEPAPTFHKDVEPILQAHCQNCHRPGEVAPMPLLSYEQTRPWAEAIRESVLMKRMPPWFAESEPAKWKNDPSLTNEELRTLVSWAETGAQKGDPKDAPPPLEFVEGWNIGVPDVVLEMPEPFEVPAQGTLAYQAIVLPGRYPEDRWIQGLEFRPGNRRVVHHASVFVRRAESEWLAHAQPGVPVPKSPFDLARTRPAERIGGFVPGRLPRTLREGQGILLPAGADIVIELHYTATGKPETDRSKVGLVFAKETPAERAILLGVGTRDIVIPPYAPNHRVDASVTLLKALRVLALSPHMHLRGKAFEIRTVLPTGDEETRLRVPRYDFDWQLNYELAEELLLPEGTRIEATGWFDNSPNNPANPDPSAEVRFGDQTWEEMMVGWVFAVIPSDQDPSSLFEKSEPKDLETED